MDKKLIAGVACGALLATGGMVLAGKTWSEPPEFADVVRVRPQMENFDVPREECKDVTTTRYVEQHDKLTNGTVLGAVAGAAVGSQVGSGSGRRAATLLGAVAGGFAGREADRRRTKTVPVTETKRQCTTVTDTRAEVVGYHVTYHVDGEKRTVYMDRDPGDRVRLADVQALSEPAETYQGW
jgi:uncharacterized protein YcfJ